MGELLELDGFWTREDQVSQQKTQRDILPKVPNGKMVIFQEEKTTESGVREFEKNPGMYDRHLYMYIYTHMYINIYIYIHMCIYIYTYICSTV